jgi:subtilisin family serine protease
MKKRPLLVTLFCLLSVVLLGQEDKGVTKREGHTVIKGELIVKVKEEFRALFLANDFSQTPIANLFEKFTVSNISKKFTRIHKPRVESNRDGYKLVDLSNVYKIIYTKDFNEFTAAEMFYSSGMFEYSEAQIIPDLLHTPDDPKVGAQYHLSVINAFDAWDIQKGDTNIIVGIVDTGIDTDHPDLIGRIKKNYNDPIDGVDNDNDGFIDNFIGWDTGENDNDPEVWHHHGNQVTGMAVANTNNGANIAAIGYDVMVLPVKIVNGNGYLTGAYDGIVYAADHGADVINCSWGGAVSYSQYSQDIINYATINRGAVVVAAAGNNNSTNYFYPASYDNVLSVGGTNALDEKWIQSGTEGSQYNDKVDVTAPAHNVVGLWKGGGSGMVGRGTSFASPIVSGLAGLVKSEYPNASPQKIAAIIKSSTDDIYGVGGNSAYTGQLGTGRVNAYKALLPITTPFITYFNHKTDDGFDQNLGQGDTVILSLELINQLGATSNLSVLLRSNDGMSEVLDSISFIYTLGSNESKETASDFKFVVSGTSGVNSSSMFEVEITDGTNVWFDNFGVQVNKDYIDIVTNNLCLSFNNHGRIGYTFSGNGLGVDYKGSGSLIKEMGVLLGVSSDNVLSYEDYELLTFDNATVVSGSADFIAKGKLDDSWAFKQIGVKIDQMAYAWRSSPNEDFVIYEYIVKNPTAIPMEGIYLGVYGDWNIGNGNDNYADFDATKDLGYVYEAGGIYAGIKALRSKKVNYYAFDKSGNDGINIKDGYDDAEEFLSMSSGITHITSSGDVAHIVSHGPYTVPPGDSIVVAFAIVAGSDLKHLRAHAQSAEVKYESIRGINIEVNDIENISCNGSNDGKIDIEVSSFFEPYTIDWFHDSTETTSAVTGLSAGNYNVAITDKNGISKLINFNIIEPQVLEANLISTTNVDCKGEKNGSAYVEVNGGTGSYSYDWGNPIIPTIENPQLSEGTYEVIISDMIGCSDTLSVNIEEPDGLSVQTVWLLNDTATNCEGEASLLATGGVSPYLFSWNNNSPISDKDMDGLCGGDYNIVVSDANGCEFEHKIEIVAPEEEGGTNTIKEVVLDFKLYPNPANEYLVVEFKSIIEGDMLISVVDLNGRLIQKVFADKVGFDNYKVILNSTKYHTGSYFIRMTTHFGASSFQFEIQH